MSRSLRQLSIQLPNMCIAAVLDLLPNVDIIYWKHTVLRGYAVTSTQAFNKKFPNVRTIITAEHKVKYTYVPNLLKTFSNLQQLCLWTPIDFDEDLTLHQVR